jgi:hypothetical protein
MLSSCERRQAKIRSIFVFGGVYHYFSRKKHADHTTTFQTIGTFFVFNITTIIAARYAATPQTSLGYAFVAMLFVYGFFYDFKYECTSTSHCCSE